MTIPEPRKPSFELNDLVQINFSGHPAHELDGRIEKVYIHPDETGASWYRVQTTWLTWDEGELTESLTPYTLPEQYLTKIEER